MTIIDNIELDQIIEDIDALLGFDQLKINAEKFEKKEDFYKSVCKKAEEIAKNESSSIRFRVNLACAKIYEKISHKKADKHFEFCLSLASTPEEKQDIFYEYANSLLNRNNIEKARKYIDVAISVCKRSCAKSYVVLAKILRKTGHLLEAQSILQKVLSSDIDSKEILAEANNLLGIICFTIGLSEEAVKYFENALDGYPNYKKGKVLGNLGNAYLKRRKFDKARQLFSERKDIAEYYGDHLGIIRSNLYIGMLDFKEKESKDALLCFKYALQYNQETVKSAMDEAAINLNLGVVYAELEQFEKAERFYLRSLDFYKNYPNAPELKQVEENLKFLKIRKEVRAEITGKAGDFGFEEDKSYSSMLESYDKHIINEALNRADFNVSKAAKNLDLPTSTLRSKMDSLGINPSSKK